MTNTDRRSPLAFAQHMTGMTRAALENLEECGMTDSDITSHVLALRDGSTTRSQLLADMLDGADADRVQGWRDYVYAVVLESEVH